MNRQEMPTLEIKTQEFKAALRIPDNMKVFDVGMGAYGETVKITLNPGEVE